MSFGATAPPLILEGDYSDWAVYDTFVDSEAVDTFMYQHAICNRAETKLLLIITFGPTSPYKGAIRSYDIASKTLSAKLSNAWLEDSDGSSELFSEKSAYGTYCVVIAAVDVSWDDADRVFIYKDGVLIKTLTDSDLGITSGKIRSVSISPKGKYIIVSGYITAESAMGWVVLVGS